MSESASDSVFVTGAHGFIGRHLVRLLADTGYHVVAPARDAHDRDDTLPAEIVVLDVADPAAVEAAMQGCAEVIHLAARAGGIQFQEGGGASVFTDNRAITDAVFAAAVATGVRRMFVASSAVAYRPAGYPVGEDHDLLGPGDHPSPYAWSKITDEAAAHWLTDSGQLEAVIGRFANVYGPGAPFDPDRSTVIHGLIRRAAETPSGEVLQVWGDGSAVRSFIYVEDVARAILTSLDAGEPGTAYNIDSGVGVTIHDLAAAVRDAVDPTLQLEFDASKPAGLPFRVTSPARLNDLGYKELVTLEDGIARTVEAFRDEAGRS